MELRTTDIRVIQDHLVPSDCRPAGWAALCSDFSIVAPLRHLSCVATRHIRGSRRTEHNWEVFDKRYWPGETIGDHLGFAFKHEPLDLLLLIHILNAIPVAVITDFIKNAPVGQTQRRVWFLLEYLTGQQLDIPNVKAVAAIDLLNPQNYVTGIPRLSKRHRVRNNLLGIQGFCPIIRRTPQLDKFMSAGIEEQAQLTIGKTGAHLLTRAASFMLLADSQASFAIEGERPPRSRLERWGRAVMQAGKHPLTLDEILRLHAILIEDTRFVHAGLRPDGVFLGERTHNGDPLPEFIGAKPEDLPDLMHGLIGANDQMRSDHLDPVIQATVTAFGFIYIHPFQDGNGRVHRCLIHHVLAERGFTPPGMVFPVSAVMLDQIDNYRNILQNHTSPLMPFIEWRPTPERNIETINETINLYRYFDCTAAAEFLYSCVQHTVEHDLPREIDYLQRHDEALNRIVELVEMPDRLAGNLLLFINQNNGKLAHRRRQKEFGALTDKEVMTIEQIIRDVFVGFQEE